MIGRPGQHMRPLEWISLASLALAAWGCARLPEVEGIAASRKAEAELTYVLPRTVLRVEANAVVAREVPESRRCPTIPAGGAARAPEEPGYLSSQVSYLRTAGLHRQALAGPRLVLTRWTVHDWSEPDPEARFQVHIDRRASLQLTFARPDASRHRPAALRERGGGAILAPYEAVGGVYGTDAGPGSAPHAPSAQRKGTAPQDSHDRFCATALEQIQHLDAALAELHKEGRGTGSPSIIAYKREHLRTLRRDLASHFTGVRYEAVGQLVCDVRPVHGRTYYPLVTQMSGGEVTVGADDVISCHLPAGAGDASFAEPQVVLLNVELHQPDMPSTVGIHRRSPKEACAAGGGPRSFHYRVPALARVQVEQHVTPQGSHAATARSAAGPSRPAPAAIRTGPRVLPVAQLGCLASLPRSRTFGDVGAVIDVHTGALISLGGEDGDPGPSPSPDTTNTASPDDPTPRAGADAGDLDDRTGSFEAMVAIRHAERRIRNEAASASD